MCSSTMFKEIKAEVNILQIVRVLWTLAVERIRELQK